MMLMLTHRMSQIGIVLAQLSGVGSGVIQSGTQLIQQQCLFVCAFDRNRFAARGGVEFHLECGELGLVVVALTPQQFDQCAHFVFVRFRLLSPFFSFVYAFCC